MTREEREQRADARAERRVYLQTLRLEETRKRTDLQFIRLLWKMGPMVAFSIIGIPIVIWDIFKLIFDNL